MEFLFIVIAIVYSIWSEVNKKKKEEEVDIDFSELSSLDDFFKPGQASTGGDTRQPKKKAVKSKPEKSMPRQPVNEAINYDSMTGPTRQTRHRADKKPHKEEVNYDNLPALSGQVNYARTSENSRKAEVNYDEQAILTGRVNYERDSAFAVPVPAIPVPTSQTSSEAVSSETFSENFSVGQFRFGTNDMTKAIILAEVLQRYDMARIYSRIPEFESESEE